MITVGMISLGCAKNLVDSEVMLGLLAQAGFRITPRRDEADVLVVNTCGFIREAKEEAIEAILEAAREKESGRCRALVVAGCLAQRYREELKREIPEIDAVLGTGEVGRIADLVKQLLGRGANGGTGGAGGGTVNDEEEAPPGFLYGSGVPRIRSTPPYTAYLKIAEGCDNRCSYCVIPYLRGPYRSRPLEVVLEEAESLAAQGVKELILVAQDTTLYGMDLYGRPRLPELLARLAAVRDLRWIRVLYTYPARITGELAEVMAGEPKVCRYLDLPFQHGSDRILRAMNRRGSRDEAMRLVENLRARLPGLAIRTSFIVGFPGEEEGDFQQLLDFMEKARFDHAGVFLYSREEGTPAGYRSDQVPEKLKCSRYRRAMRVQRRISREINRSLVGSRMEVLVEEIRGRGLVGRGPRHAPGVDGVVYLTNGRAVPGDFVSARLTGATDYDLRGEVDVSQRQE